MNNIFYSEAFLCPKNKDRLLKNLMKMKLTGFLLAASSFGAYASSHAQVTIKVHNTKVENVLKNIMKQTGVHFVYEEGLLKNHKTSLEVRDVSLNASLEQIFKNSHYTYLIRGNNVIIKNEDRTVKRSDLQDFVMKGAVLDVHGTALLGATVSELGASNSVQTDTNGNFIIKVSGAGSKVRVNIVGFDSQTVSFSPSPITIKMVASSNQMDEVVVVGFGQQKKESVVGAISTISPKDLKIPTSTLSNAFAGRIAGVVAVQRGGEPGADGSSFWIRGISTFAGNTNPLIFIDGVESSIGDMNNLAPEVIDNFSVLKDASATALYGARGANGVLLITTKRGGDMDKARISFRVDNTFSTPTKTFKLAGALDYMETYNYALLNRNPNATPQFSQEKIEGTRLGLDPIAFPNVDWGKFLFKDYAVNQYANLNVTGGGKRADYFMSATFNNDNGMLKSDPQNTFNNNVRQKEYNIIANIGVNLTKNTSAVVRINSQLVDYGGSAESTSTIYSRMFESPVSLFLPYYPAQSGVDNILFGNMLGGPISSAGSGIYFNPYASMVSGSKSTFATTNMASFEINQKLDFVTPGLKAKALISFKNYSLTAITRAFTPFYYQANSVLNSETGAYDHTYTNLTRGTTSLATSTLSSGDRLMNINGVVGWMRSFGKHDVSAMAAYLQRDYNVNNPAAGPTDSEYWNTLPYRNQGVAGRITYGYDLKYFFEANFGYNGSENFADGARYGFFPSLAVGYMISNEGFWSKLKNTINSLKIRTSWGKVGNDQIQGSRFPYLDKVTPNSLGYTFGDTWQNSASGSQIATLGALGAIWEVGTKYNLGVDLGIKNALTLTADYFTETRSNIFMQRRVIAAETGIVGSNPYANIGIVKSSGFDASLSYNKQFSSDFYMNVRGTFTYSANKLLDRDEPKLAFPYLSEIGKPLNRYFGYISDGYYIDEADIANSPKSEIGQNLMPGDIKYKDLNNDGLINTNDRTHFGNPTVPQIVYGFGISSKYKNIDFSFFFQGVAKTSLMMSGIHPFNGNATNLMQFIADDHWTTETPNAAYPRLVSGVSDHNNFYTSDFWIRDGSFIRLKNSELGYTHKFARFYLSGQNLLTFSKFKHWDPELGGGNGLRYPNLRVFAIGAQLQF